MERLFDLTGTGAGAVGAAVCLIAGIVRLSGGFYVGGFAANTLFTLGIALMVFACLMKLQHLAMHTARRE